MDNNKKERNTRNAVNTDSPTLYFVYHGMNITVSFAPSTEHTVSMEDLVNILFSSANQA